MAILTIQTISLSGLDVVFGMGSDGGDEFLNSGRTYIHVGNMNGSLSRHVFIDSLKPCSFGGTHNIDVTIPVGGCLRIGPFSRDRFNDSYGRVHVSYQSWIDMQIAAVELPLP